ncbi:molybdate ABC transporter permease subunit [Flocculibacter collagenilyticus]|uniref:molybdate ABC transporter permease subunit n=1 Tax=Flocculibacter collagenilyticus TaxID=2744479 RepID=UPI0018F34512|nr:molybdate ABC transporter permease subunit [Flocculibacter collagenilyticus]
MIDEDLTALTLTLQLAITTTLILLMIGLPVAWKLSRYHGRLKPVYEAIIALPLVLPPTVLGFYLLMAFAPDTFFGQLWVGLTGQQLAFSFSGILLGSLIYSLPFVVQPLYSGFCQVGQQYDQVAASLGISRVRRLIKITLPLMKPAILSAVTLGFAHTLGEFGLILMIGGNIPGETQVVSIALYNHVEAIDYQHAHRLAAVLLTISFISLVLLYKFNRRALTGMTTTVAADPTPNKIKARGTHV